MLIMGTEGKGWASGYLEDTIDFSVPRDYVRMAIRVGIISKFLTSKTMLAMVPIHHDNGYLGEDQIS